MKKSFENGSVEKINDENKKITDKAMTTTMMACVIGILVTATLLATTTWAWFSGSTGSSSNSIVSSYCTVDAIINDQGEEADFTVVNGNKVYSLSANVDYTVEISVVGTASGGYCKLVLGDDTSATYYTEVVVPVDSHTGISAGDNVGSLSFTVKFTTDKTVTVKSGWGIHTHEDPDFSNGGVYVFNESDRTFDSVDNP